MPPISFFSTLLLAAAVCKSAELYQHAAHEAASHANAMTAPTTRQRHSPPPFDHCAIRQAED